MTKQYHCEAWDGARTRTFLVLADSFYLAHFGALELLQRTERITCIKEL
jgi:hypothetical protein